MKIYAVGFALLVCSTSAFAQGPAAGRGAATAGVPPAQSGSNYGILSIDRMEGSGHFVGENSMAKMKKRSSRRARRAPADAAAPAGR